MAARASSALPGARMIRRQTRQSNSSLLPFLYQTQTLQQTVSSAGRASIQFYHSSNSPHAARYRHRPHGNRHSQYEEEDDLEDIPLVDAPAPEPSETQPKPTSTITPSERATFARLFDDLANDSSPYSASSLEKPDLLQPRGEVRSILYNALDRQSESSHRAGPRSSSRRTDHTSFQRLRKRSDDNEQIDEAISRYPESLRMAAQTAFGVIQQRQEHSRGVSPESSGTSGTDATTATTPSPSGGTAAAENAPLDPFTQLQQQELHRVEALLHAAQTDMELWEVLQKEVFSMVSKIDIGAEEKKLQDERKAQKAAAAAARKAEREERKRLKEQAKTSSSSAPPPADSSSNPSSNPPSPSPPSSAQAPSIPLIPIAALNYPSHLLLALRILRHSFPRSSLPYALLPAIKHLGDISFILGASTALYNELIAIHWHKDADYHAISDLLADMQARNVEFDAETLSILLAIEKDSIDPIRRGLKGQALAQVYRMQSVKTGTSKVLRWKEKVRAKLYERALKEARVKEEYGAF
ncbi:hypothetical protein L228DRAFT_248605 [Xylona heveae TC161]|uniref:Mtf2-like C-terminal domain-containing protein n=1 Tax=Xylona heveae (strain CBS 132557 / TC161) TaxID=1328760 RepID=A0A165G822_XYLHT|nr:hypothetical protein L228DRAFT_248605 [Xylona heveae TC161]KZF21850.1 hypothetical protein L228DRAFT_248605 [Xylona heveae TC161]